MDWYTATRTEFYSSVRRTQHSPIASSVADRFKANCTCPLYCRFCTRAYTIGEATTSVPKDMLKPSNRRWDAMIEYIRNTPTIEDVVFSGGDTYTLHPMHLDSLCNRLLDIPHILRIRLATKGLMSAPGRILDPADDWGNVVATLAKRGRERKKHVCIHTHFNHPNEITWIAAQAANKLFAQGVTVRNQSVLLNGVNDNVDTMGALIRGLARINIQPVSSKLYTALILQVQSLYKLTHICSIMCTNATILLTLKTCEPHSEPSSAWINTSVGPSAAL
jgi:KamA family protein